MQCGRVSVCFVVKINNWTNILKPFKVDGAEFCKRRSSDKGGVAGTRIDNDVGFRDTRPGLRYQS